MKLTFTKMKKKKHVSLGLLQFHDKLGEDGLVNPPPPMVALKRDGWKLAPLKLVSYQNKYGWFTRRSFFW